MPVVRAKARTDIRANFFMIASSVVRSLPGPAKAIRDRDHVLEGFAPVRCGKRRAAVACRMMWPRSLTGVKHRGHEPETAAQFGLRESVPVKARRSGQRRRNRRGLLP